MLIIENFILINVVMIFYNYIECNNCIQNYKFLIFLHFFLCLYVCINKFLMVDKYKNIEIANLE